MKRAVCLLTVIVMIFSMCSCNSAEKTFKAKTLGVKVKMENEVWKAVCSEDDAGTYTVGFWKKDSDDFCGSIVIAEEETGKNVDDTEVYRPFAAVGNGTVKTDISENMTFFDCDSYDENGTVTSKWCFFVYYDKELPVTLFGKFSLDSNNRDDVFALANTISVEKL